MRRFIFVFLVSILCIFFCSSCSDSFFPHGEQKAVVMLVGLDYSPKGSGTTSLKWGGYNVPKLNATLNDSKELAAAIDSLYYGRNVQHDMVVMLSEGNNPDYLDPFYPSDINIINMIGNLELDEDDLFVFYFAGHGFLKDSELNLITGEYYQGALCSSLKASKLLDSIRSLKCRSVVILDACYSGAFDPKNSSTPESFLSSLKNTFEERIVVEENNKVSVLASAKWNEQSWEGYNILFNDGSSEQHGQFSARLLDVLGWNHSNTKITEVVNANGEKIIANGYSGNISGSLSLDDIYTKIYDLRVFPSIKQNHVLYYTNESINLIPRN